MARSLTGTLALALVALAVGCAQLRFHRDRNAPGISDVEDPPPPGKTEQRETVAPRDPGENMVTFNPGVYGGAGAHLGLPKGQRAVGAAGIELTLNRGCSKRSHHKDGLLVYPFDGNGVSLGWTFLQAKKDNLDLGPIYVEVSRFRIVYGAALGYAVHPQEGDHGPQATAWFGPYFVRARYMFDGGVQLYMGGQIKIPLIWIWSR